MLAFQASAQNMQWWDNQGASPATNGTWDTTTANWANSATLTASTVTFNNNGYFPVFAAGTSGITNMTITVPGAVNCEGLGDATTTNGAASGAAITNLTFIGAGSINLPAGMWPFECGNSAPAPVITINIPITGSGGIIQHNNGQLSLYGNNNYSGGTVTTGGQIINYNNNNSFGTGPITNLSGNAIFLCTNGSANIVTITNPFYVNIPVASILDFGDGNTICSGPVLLFATTQIKNNGGSGTGLTFSGPISGAFGVNLETPSGGTMTLSGPNTYTGPTAIGDAGTATISVSSINSVTTPAQQASSSFGKPSSVANGTIAIGNAGFLGTLIYTGPGETSDRVINLAGTTGGATIEMDGAGPLVFTSAFTATGGGSKTFTLQGSSTAANAINGVIPNNTSTFKTALTKAQAGSWTLGGLNTFSGNMTISGGTLTIGGSGDLGNSGGNGSYAGTISDTATFVYNSSAAQTLGGAISGAGALQQNGAGNLTLTAANTYTGATTVGGGSTLIVSGTGKLAANTPITLNGTLNITSTAGQTADLVAGSGTLNQNAAGASTTLTNLNNTYSGLFTVTAGTLAINSDSTMGTPPGSPLANDITLNGGPAANFRANANNITISANRGITLGANGGAFQVAGNDTCTYSGIISGSGQFQVGVNATVGLGVLVLGGSEAYTNTTVLAAGTTRLSAAASLGNSSGIVMSNSATLDVSALNPFALSTTNTFTAIASTNLTPGIIGPAGGNVNFGSQTVSLSFVPALTNGDPTNLALTVSQGTLVLNGNTVNVTNASALTLDVGNYALIQSSNGISVTAPLTLNYVGPAMVANTAASLVVVGNTLVLQILPGTGYTGTAFSNLAPSQSVTYGAAPVLSGTVSAAGPVYPAQGELVTVTIGNASTNTVAIADATGDFTNVVPGTVPVGTYPITYSYPGNGTLAPAIDTSSTLTISKEPVTVTATNPTKTYGQTITFGAGSTAFTASGLQNGETIGSVTLAVSNSGGVSNAPVSGSPYTITPSAATNGTFSVTNYSITYVTGTLTVNPLPLALTGTRPYDSTATAVFSILSITNVVGTDDVTLVSGSATLAGSAAGVEPITDASGLTLGGVTAGNYTTTGATGAVIVTTTVNTGSTNIMTSFANGQLTLTWPQDHTGWQLQVQTNDLTLGLGTNWVDVAGSTTTNQVIIPINVTNGSVFYRMVYPPQ